MYIKEVLKYLHKRKISIIFIKLDISKAFDIVKWPYLLHIMEHLRFGQRWRNWISSLWGSSSSSFLLNGEHFALQGVRQGDYLSPILFIMAMELCTDYSQEPRSMGILDILSLGCDASRVSLYADAATILIKPNKHDLKIPTEIMNIFARASGLVINISKTECFPIQCDNISLDFLGRANMVVSQFPYKYLGLPLHHKKPCNSENLMANMVVSQFQSNVATCNLENRKHTSWEEKNFAFLSWQGIHCQNSTICHANLLLDWIQNA
jgi:hypothetical protein